MTTSLTETAAWSTPVIVPANGDPADDVTLNAPAQALANRTALLNSVLGVGGGVVGTGVKRVYQVTSTANLKAIPTPTDGDVAMLTVGMVPFGLYRFSSGLTDTETDPWIFTATGGVTGVWFHHEIGSLGYGLAYAPASGGKIATATSVGYISNYVHGQTMSVGQITCSGSTTLTNSWEEPASCAYFGGIAGNTVLISPQVSVNYYLLVIGTGRLQDVTGAGTLNAGFRMTYAVDGGSDTVIGNAVYTPADTSTHYTNFPYLGIAHLSVGYGAHHLTFSPQIHSTSGGQVNLADGNVLVMLMRGNWP